MLIDAMNREDWPQVRQIYSQGIATRNATFETVVPEWDVWNAKQVPEPRLVARDGEAVLGFAALSRAARGLSRRM